MKPKPTLTGFLARQGSSLDYLQRPSGKKQLEGPMAGISHGAIIGMVTESIIATLIVQKNGLTKVSMIGISIRRLRAVIHQVSVLMVHWIWRAMYGNGRQTGMIIPIIKIRRVAIRRALRAVAFACCAVVPGTMIRTTCAPPSETSTLLKTGITQWVSGCGYLRSPTFDALYSDSFSGLRLSGFF